MAVKISTGATNELRFQVELKHAIDFANETMPAVLSTPWLIWFLEHTARETVLPTIEAGETTVGTVVEIRHLAATPIGETVTCVAKVVGVDGAEVSFQLEARDEHEIIARGYHKLRVINVERFAKRVAKKLSSA